jgi:hypothetical protein
MTPRHDTKPTALRMHSLQKRPSLWRRFLGEARAWYGAFFRTHL